MRWLDKQTRMERNKLILKLRAQGLTIKQIATQTKLTPHGIEEVLYVRKKDLAKD